MSILAIIQKIACLICGHHNELPTSTSTATITKEELWTLLYKRFPQMGALYLSDKEYRLCSLKDIREFLHQDATNHYQYKADAFDCDDFLIG